MSNIFIAIKLVAVAMMAKLNGRFGIESQKGVSLIEYALIGALIAVAAVAMLDNVGTSVNEVFGNINTKLDF